MSELADIFRRHGPEYRATCTGRMPPRHLEALEAIEPCRTEALGGHVSQCTDCGALDYRSHACKNRHGPQCQHEEATPWLQKQPALLRPLPSCLVPWTLPDAWRDVARSHQALLDTMLFQTASAALKELALAPPDLGGQIGMVGVLQPWTREMTSPPHLHDIVPAGALSPDGSTWLSPRDQDWLVPVRARSTRFRDTCKEALPPAGLLDHVAPQVWHKDWGTHGEPVGTGQEVIPYLALSIRRMAITNNRLDTLEDGHVTFRVKDSASGEWTHRTLPAEEFIRRFLPHGLPKGFINVRYVGFLSPTCRAWFDHIRRLLAASPCTAPSPPHRNPQESAPHDPQPAPAKDLRGRTCGGPLVFVLRLSANKSAPP